ncbi:ion channel [Flavobacterium cellulosilyticum]|uniref:Two pore domain potassium channel family protein n=1 Tax=Flavobacterium cellulosilyticum TaxID=2541731 RepID=A0A4V2Z021_9FLAO|nr:ion channel [Flavobacterium cellulosilyticum]TDD99317.1 two pore domain potassium channel family protein [Flavobacterium cellulosilyticum]
MNYFLFFLGILLLLVTAADLINTSLSVRGAGFISKRLSTSIWRVLLVLNKKMGHRKVLELGGAFILVSILINWLLLIWVSASLLFISCPDSLMNVETNTSTTVINKIFYTGYTLSTLGLGDMEASNGFWDILTAILSFTGLILISIAITYLIPVVSAEIMKRKISVHIHTLGGSVEEILLNYWNGKDFKELEQPFIGLIDSIILHAQNHKAYSVLHFFHSSNKKEAFVLNLTNLDEVLTVLLHNIPKEQQPSINVLGRLRKAISSYLETLPASFIIPGKKTPPVVILTTLENKGIKIISGETVDLEYNKLKTRRQLLLSLIKDDGWEWTDLNTGSYNHEINTIETL